MTLRSPMEPEAKDGRRPRARARFSGVVFALSLTVVGASFAQMKPGDVKKAYGEPRASVMESLLTTLYPGAEVTWDPSLMVRLPGENPRTVALPVYVRGNAAGDGLEGVGWVELDGAKERFIYEAQNFRRSDRREFPTELIVFRADMAGRVQRYKRLMLDPAEPLTEVKDISNQDWSQNEWPTLQILYQTHRATPTAFTTIEWRGTLDANSGKFVSRLPSGISRQTKGGPDQLFSFGLGRIDPGTVVLENRFGGERHTYSCSDPCVFDADTLLSEWKLNDPPATDRPANGSTAATATNKRPANSAGARVAANAGGASSSAVIHLKNGRTIHADTTKEAGDKLEYTMGESEYQIPKSLVLEIVHTTDAPPRNDNPNAQAPPSSRSQAAETPCSADTVMATPQIPCKVAFYVQTLMGLGETQRFSLIDDGNHDVTAQAQWSILDFGSEVDFSVVNGVPHIFSKKYGMVTLYATVGDKSAMTRIGIVTPEEMSSNTMGRKGAPMFQDSRRPLQLIPAEPYVGRIP